MELEGCPRRWALANAEYSNLWNSRGYPFLPQPSALEGAIVHLSLQKITVALVENGCSSLADESAIFTLRQLGGYTAIIMDSLAHVLLPYMENPRTVPALGGIRTRLTAKVPELRARVQRFLSRIRPVPRVVPGETFTFRKGEPHHALQHGSYTEVLLQAPELGWRGIADMLTVSTTQCEIRDFKTGAPKEEHHVQLWTYALLWARDADLNPSGRLADKLVLSYYEGDEEVLEPSTKELLSLEDELRQRTEKALTQLQAELPEPRLSLPNCAYCTVRHLCDEYWPWYDQKGENHELAKNQFIDLQVKVSGQHGPRSWDCIVEFGAGLKVGKPVLLRTANLQFDLRSGQRLRVLNVYVNSDDKKTGKDKTAPFVVTMRANSEVFLLG